MTQFDVFCTFVEISVNSELLYFWALLKIVKIWNSSKNAHLERRCYFLPFHFFPHFSKNRRVEGNSNFKSAISFHFYIDLRNYYFLPFWLLFPSILQNCYFLPLFLINKSISKSANLRSLHLQNKSLFNYNSNLYAEGLNICLSCTQNGIFCPSYFFASVAKRAAFLTSLERLFVAMMSWLILKYPLFI